MIDGTQTRPLVDGAGIVTAVVVPLASGQVHLVADLDQLESVFVQRGTILGEQSLFDFFPGRKLVTWRLGEFAKCQFGPVLGHVGD